MASVPVLTRVQDKPTVRQIVEASDWPSMSTIVGSQAARSMWADAAATSADLVTGANVATVNLATGAAAATINFGTGANPTINLGGATSQLKTYGGSVIETQATDQTTTATPKDVVTIALANNTVYMLQVWITARRTDAAARAAYIRNACVYREAAGIATIQGTVDTQFTRESPGAALWGATIGVSGNNVTITVTGATSETVNWTVAYTLRSRA